jgi:hypothetical protein
MNPDDPPIREPDQIRQDCARKFRAVHVSDHFQAILGCLLGEDVTTPRLVEMQITSDGHMLRRCEGDKTYKETRRLPMRALSIRQPWAELILRGVKTIEGRTKRTNKKGERVHIYAGLQRIEPDEESRIAAEFSIDVDALPRGVLVGTVEIVGCEPLSTARPPELRSGYKSRH